MTDKRSETNIDKIATTFFSIALFPGFKFVLRSEMQPKLLSAFHPFFDILKINC